MYDVLIVDDNEMNRDLAAEALDIAGCRTRCAASGREGIRMATESRPDLILMDLRMPGMSGLEALREIRRTPELKDIPVAVLTASAMVGDCEQLLAEGFDAYFAKPIDVIRFGEEVVALLDSKSGKA